MKKILHLIDSFTIGGAERLLVSSINGLDGKFEQHLIVLAGPAPLAAELPPSCKVTVLSFVPKKIWGIRGFVKRYIKEHHIDIVHSQLYWSNTIARLAAGKKVPVFNTIQAISSEASYKINRITLYLEKLTYKKRHHIIGVSKAVLDDFDKWVGLKGPSSVLYNMIDDKHFAPHPKTTFSENGLKLVAVGNLRWQKNYEYAIEAFKKMPSNVSLDIYGEGELRPKLQQQIDEHKLNIRLCGHHLALHEILSGYDMVLMCSLYEGFSLGLMEAMASGLPPVVSDIPVLREAGGDVAVYLDLKDPDDLVRKMEKILSAKEQLPKLSEAAWQRAKAMASKEEFFAKLLSLYAAS